MTSVNPSDLTLSSTATPEQQAKYQALSQLAGIDNTLIPDSDQIGKYDTEALADIDFNALRSRVANQQQDYLNSDILNYWLLKRDYDQNPTDGKYNQLADPKYSKWHNKINTAVDDLNRTRMQYGLPALTPTEASAAMYDYWLKGQRRDQVQIGRPRENSPTIPTPSTSVSRPTTNPTPTTQPSPSTSPTAPPSSTPGAPPSSTPTPPTSPPLVGGPVTAPSTIGGSKPRDPSWGNLVVPQSAPTPAPVVAPTPVVAAPSPVGIAPSPIAPSPAPAITPSPAPSPVAPPPNKAIITPVLQTPPVINANKERQMAESAQSLSVPPSVSSPVVAQTPPSTPLPVVAPSPVVAQSQPSPVVAQSLPSSIAPTLTTSKLVPSAPAPTPAPTSVSPSKLVPSASDAQVTALISKILKGA